MKVEIIKYSAEFKSLEGNRWFGIEGTIDPGETPLEAYRKAEAIVKEAAIGQTDYSSIPSHPQSTPVVQVQKPVAANPAVLIPQIEACTQIDGIDGLSSWRKIVEKNPALQDAYDRTRSKIIGIETKKIFDATDALIKPTP